MQEKQQEAKLTNNDPISNIRERMVRRALDAPRYNPPPESEQAQYVEFFAVTKTMSVAVALMVKFVDGTRFGDGWPTWFIEGCYINRDGKVLLRLLWTRRDALMVERLFKDIIRGIGHTKLKRVVKDKTSIGWRIPFTEADIAQLHPVYHEFIKRKSDAGQRNDQETRNQDADGPQSGGIPGESPDA